MICLRGIAKTYEMGRDRPIEALRRIDLDIERGEFVVITGRSGAGKTTLLNVIAGLARPTSGTVTVDGVDLWSLSDRRLSLLRNRTMGFVFQFPSLLASLSVLHNVALPSPSPTALTATDRREPSSCSTMVGLADRLSGLPRPALGRSAAAGSHRPGPRQPSRDPAGRRAQQRPRRGDGGRDHDACFGRIHAETGVTIALVTHTRQLVAYGTRHLAMASGELVGADCGLASVAGLPGAS